VSRDEFFDRAAAFNDLVMSESSEAVKSQKQIIIDRLKIFKEQLEWSLKLDEKISDSHWKEQIAGECLPVITLAADFIKDDANPVLVNASLNSVAGLSAFNPLSLKSAISLILPIAIPVVPAS
jgi:hypothetical protein